MPFVVSFIFTRICSIHFRIVRGESVVTRDSSAADCNNFLFKNLKFQKKPLKQKNGQKIYLITSNYKKFPLDECPFHF